MIGLVSTFAEGRLAEDAVHSLYACCNTVLVAEGPIGDATGEHHSWKRSQRGVQAPMVYHGEWESDAAKRTFLLEKSRRFNHKWGVILDGDELLMWGEYLPAVVEWFDANARLNGKESLRVPIRLVDGDSTTSVMTGRVLRLDLIERYLISSYHVLLTNGVEVSLANGKLRACGEPDSTEADVSTGFQLRRPLQGEPHILHRSFLRSPERVAERQSVAEGTAFDQLVKQAGLGEAHGESVRDERTGIWVPTSQ